MAERTWADDEKDLLQMNYSSEDIALERQRQYNDLVSLSYDQKEIDNYFGTKQPNLDPVKQMVESNYQKYVVNADKDVKDFFDFFDRTVMGKNPNPTEDKVSMGDAFKEGLQESVPVMQYKAAHGDSVLTQDNMPPEYFDSFDRAARMAGTVAGDFPYMVAGAVGGAAITAAAIASAPVTIPTGLAIGATVFAAGAASNALPAALRSHLVNFYEKGEVTSFGDFLERLTSVVVDTGKEGVIGGTTELVGGKVAGKVAQKGGGYLLQRGSSAFSELATMVGMKSAIENEAPSLQEFQDAAILIAGLSGSTYTAGKLFKIYKDTGVRPASVADEAKRNTMLMEELKSANDQIPQQYQDLVTPIQQDIDMASSVLTKNALEATGDAPKPANMVELTPAESASKKIRESIGQEEKSAAGKFYEDIKGIKSKEDALLFGKKIYSGPVANAAREYYAAYVNRFAPIKEVSEKAFEGYKLLSGASGLSRTFIEDHTFDFNTKKANGESLSTILNEVPDLIEFENYLVANRVKELRSRGVEQISKMTDDEVNSLVKRDSAKYDKLAKRFYAFEDRVLDYVKKSGRFSYEDIANIKSLNRNHISLKKIIDPTDTGKGAKAKDPYKRIGSSDLQIRNPLVSTLDNIEAVMKLSQMNKAKLDFIKDAEAKELVEKIPVPKKQIKVTEDELAKGLQESGFITRKSFYKDIKSKFPSLKEEDIEKAFQKEYEYGNVLDEDSLKEFSIFRSAKSFLKENEIEVWDNGKKVVYEIKDPVLAKAVKSFDENPYMQGMAFNAARGVTRAFKLGTTGIPDFIAQNVFVDYVTSVVKSTDLKSLKDNMSPQLFKDSLNNNLAAISSLVKKDAGFYEYLKSGASGSGWTDAETALLKITEGKYNTKEFSEANSKVRNVLRTAKEYYEASQLISEHFVRIKKFQEMVRKGENTNKAAIAAKDETLDFSQRGYSRALANMSAITAFQNVAIQGADNFVRTVSNDPKKIAINGAAVLTIPAIALWLANKDDERIDERPEWERLTYFHLATDDWKNVSNEYDMAEANALMGLERHANQVRTLPDGTVQLNRGIIMKIKKPPVYGEIFATLPTILLDKFFSDKPQDLNEFSKSFFQNAMPSVIPNIAIPAVEQFANKSFFTGNSIIPYTMEKTSPEFQYTEYTNPSARALGKLIEAMPIVGDAAKQMNLSSPIVLENYIRQWTGGGGMYLLQLASKATPQEAYQTYDIQPELKKPASTLADIPFIKRFVSRNPSASMKSITDFGKYYEKYAQLEADSSIERQRWNFENFSVLKQQQLDSFAPIKGISDAMKNQTALIHITYKRPDLNETEKRQLIDATYYQMLGLAQQGLEMVRQFEQEQKQLKEMGIEQ